VRRARGHDGARLRWQVSGRPPVGQDAAVIPFDAIDALAPAKLAAIHDRPSRPPVAAAKGAEGQPGVAGGDTLERNLCAGGRSSGNCKRRRPRSGRRSRAGCSKIYLSIGRRGREKGSPQGLTARRTQGRLSAPPLRGIPATVAGPL